MGEGAYRKTTAYPASRKYSALVLTAIPSSQRPLFSQKGNWYRGRDVALTAPRVPAEKLSMKRTVCFSACRISHRLARRKIKSD